MSFLGGGEGLISCGTGLLSAVGGLGARCGLPWLTRGRSERSDVERDEDGVGVGGADERDVMLPPICIKIRLSDKFGI